MFDRSHFLPKSPEWPHALFILCVVMFYTFLTGQYDMKFQTHLIHLPTQLTQHLPKKPDSSEQVVVLRVAIATDLSLGLFRGQSYQTLFLALFAAYGSSRAGE